MPSRPSKPTRNKATGAKGPKKPSGGRGPKTGGKARAGGRAKPSTAKPYTAKKSTGKPSTGKPSTAKKSTRRGAAPSGPPRTRRPAASRPASPVPASSVSAPPRSESDGKDRLQKVLAAAGLASRRECEQLILEGRVMVDGEVAAELGVRVDPTQQEILVDGEPLPRAKRVYFAVNKPEGYVCTARDPSGRPRVTELLPAQAGRVFNVGRLDMASDGLILLTNDGELANQLTHPRHGVRKTYVVQVAGHITPEELKTARDGVYMAEGKAHFVGAKIKSRHKKSTLLEVVLDEGKNREIRRVLAAIGHKVQKLTRVAVGPVKLGEMPAGAYRPLTRDEVKALRQCVVESEAERALKPVKKAKRKASPTRSKRTTPTRTPTPAGKAKPQRRIIG